jgi:hypothetical protein
MQRALLNRATMRVAQTTDLNSLSNVLVEKTYEYPI